MIRACKHQTVRQPSARSLARSCEYTSLCMHLPVQVTLSSPGLEVRLDAGEAKGKGVFATKASLRDLAFLACSCGPASVVTLATTLSEML